MTSGRATSSARTDSLPAWGRESGHRVLSPGRSMYRLTFSRRATPPICRDLPRAMPIGNGRYRVRSADGRLQELGGAAEAVAVIVEGLPYDAVPRP
ncbi:DUF6193 family natural product biosynthesis protein [Streptomyces sp. MS1.HAVA.3]|uniref:DUF6193 family natural product biosynthesis protein n=1 Tax=Streptomyces caledonius TaxID=3134107 RepID=A0ABU8UEN7_9ACTN